MFPHARRQSRRDSRAPRQVVLVRGRVALASRGIVVGVDSPRREGRRSLAADAFRPRRDSKATHRTARGTPRRGSSLAPRGFKTQNALAAPTAHRPDISSTRDADALAACRRRGGSRESRRSLRNRRVVHARAELANDSEPANVVVAARARGARARGRASACSPTLAKITLAPSRSARSTTETRSRARSRAVDARRVSSDTTTRGWISSWRCV